MATKWQRELDPHDDCEFEMDFTPILDDGETVQSFAVEPTEQAAAAGLLVGDGAYAPVEVEPGVIRIWLSIAEAKRSSPDLQGNGILLGVTGSIVTTADPARSFRREWRVRVKPL